MQKQQVRRSTVRRRMAEKAAAEIVVRPHVRLTSPAARNASSADIRTAATPMKKGRKAPRMTSTQRDSTGAKSAWSEPANLPYVLSVTTHQPRWSMTVNNFG